MAGRGLWVRRLGIVFALLAGFLLYVQWMPVRARLHRTERSLVGKQWKSGIHIAVVWPYLLQGGTILDRYYHRFPILSNRLSRGPILRSILQRNEETVPSFPQGMQMALEYLRDKERREQIKPEHRFAESITLDRHFEHEFMGPDAAVTLAENLASDESVVAVAGHYGSRAAIIASVVYEREKLLFLTPTATIPQLTNHEFTFTFRMTPDDGDLAMSMARFAKSKNFKRIGIFYSRTPEGESLQPRIAESARIEGLEVAFTKSYVGGPNEADDLPDFRPTISTIERFKVDAIFLADALPRAGKLIRDLRSMNMRQPVIGSEYLQEQRLFDDAGDATEEIYVSSAVNPQAKTPNYEELLTRYKQRYPDSQGVHRQPSYPFSQGYETMLLLYEAIKRAQSADPILVSNRLRTDKSGWHGLFGMYRFALEGAIECRSVSIKRVDFEQRTFVVAGLPDGDGGIKAFEYTPNSKGDDENEKCPTN